MRKILLRFNGVLAGIALLIFSCYCFAESTTKKTQLPQGGLSEGGLLEVKLQQNIPHKNASNAGEILESPNPEKFKDKLSDTQVITVTAARRPSELNEVSSSVDRVNSEALSLIGHAHINQALARIPGTWISRGNGQEHLTAIRSPVLTGAGACGAFYMSEDGISLRAPGFCNVNQLFDANSEQADTIEVVRGPGSVLYGSNAVHGIINIISPDLFDHPSDYLGLEVGSYEYLRSRFRFSKINPKNAYGVYGNFTNDNGYQQQSGFDQQKINFKHQFQSKDFSSKSLLSISNINQETAGFIRGKDAFKDDQLRRTNPNPEAYRDSQSWRAYSQLNWELSTDTQFSITPYARYTNMEFIQHFVPWEPIERNAHQSFGMKSLYSHHQDDFNWYVGLDWEVTRGELAETQTDDFSETIPQGTHYDYQVKNFIASPFFDLNWFATPRLIINAAIRYDNIRYDYDNLLEQETPCATEVPNCRFFSPGDHKRNFSDWSPRLSMTYLTDQKTQWYVEATRGFRAPQATELFRLQAGQRIADLTTERLTSIQSGFRGRVSDFNYDLSLYHLDKRNFIFQDSERQVVSNGETSHRGVELSLAYDFTERWKFSLAASYAKHRYENNLLISQVNIKNNQIDTAPNELANARITWAPSNNYLWELEMIYLGDYFLNPENTARYNGHQLFHLRGQVNLSENLQVTLRLLNLADKAYAERADFAFGSYRYFVGQPRSFLLGVQYIFD